MDEKNTAPGRDSHSGIQDEVEEDPENPLNKIVFFQCFRKIRPYLHLDSLCSLLWQNGVIKKIDDYDMIKSHSHLPKDKLILLIEILERSGQRGFNAFYHSLKEYALECRGHEDVIDIIKEHPKLKHEDIAGESSYKLSPFVSKELLKECHWVNNLNGVILGLSFEEIKLEWLDLVLICDYLMEYGVINSSTDLKEITGCFCKPGGQITSLMRVVERAGRDGIIALYASLYETREECSGHREAIAILDKNAKPQIATALPTSTKSQINYLEAQFCGLKEAFYAELVKNKKKVDDVITCFNGLPDRLHREWYRSVKKSDIWEDEHIRQLCFSLGNVWNFVDYGLLEHTIRRMCSSSLQRQMSEYVNDMSLFMRNTTVSSLIRSWRGRSEAPREYEKVMVNIGEDPRQCTLEKLLKAREEITTRFLPRLSELVMLLGEVGEGSVLVTWLLSKNLFNILVEGVISYESQIIFGQSLILQFRFEDSSFPPQFEQISEEDSACNAPVTMMAGDPDPRILKYLKDNETSPFIDERVFKECYYEIRACINLEVLVPYLVKYQLLSANDEKYLTNSFILHSEKCNYLVDIAGRDKRNGYMLLYICFLESIRMARSHIDVVEKLDKVAENIKENKDAVSIADSGYANSCSSFEDELEPLVEKKVNGLRESFSNIANLLLQNLKEKNCSIEDLKLQLTFLPEETFSEILASLSEEMLTDYLSPVQVLFDFLNTRMWNFMDYQLLKLVTDIFGTEETKRQMASYVQQFEHFQLSTTVQEFSLCWDGNKIKPSQCYSEFEVKFTPDHVKNFTLKVLSEFQEKIQKLFLLSHPHSEYVMIHYGYRSSGFVVTYVLPWSLALKIKEGILALKSYEVFESFFVEYVAIQSEVVYESKEYTSRSKVLLHRLKKDYSLPSLNKDGDNSRSTSKWSIVGDYYMTHHQQPTPDVWSGSSTIRPEEKFQVSTANDTVPISTKLPQNTFEVHFNLKKTKSKHNGGTYPSIALNNNGVVVEVCHKVSMYWMQHRVGRLQGGEVDWSASPSLKYYGTGSYPQVSLNDRNTVVEVHGGDFREKCYYCIGKVNTDRGIVEWLSSQSFERSVGHYPNVAINNGNYVVVIYQKDVLTKTLCYRIGKISEVSGKIVWNKKATSVKRKAENFSMDINNNNKVVLALQLNYQLYYCVGEVKYDEGEIQWSDPVKLYVGCLPSISINDNNRVLLAHKHILNQNLFCNVGQLDAGRIVWSHMKSKSMVKCGKGKCPSICVNNSDCVLEAHMGDFPKINHIHINIGQLTSL